MNLNHPCRLVTEIWIMPSLLGVFVKSLKVHISFVFRSVPFAFPSACISSAPNMTDLGKEFYIGDFYTNLSTKQIWLHSDTLHDDLSAFYFLCRRH